MKKIIDRYFPKKFKTRVRHFCNAQYTVEWCSYRFIPIWYSLLFWFDQGHPGGTEGWMLRMWDYKKAESIASRIKSKSDLEKYYQPFKKEAEKWKADEKDFWKKNAPYSTRVINQ